MSHLLYVSRLQSKAVGRKGVVPLMLEYTVPEETAPYLVSSSSSVMWITETHPNSTIKAAIREVTVGDFFREVIEAVAAMGRQQNWGNVHPLTHEGLAAAIDHVAFYELEPLELLVPRVHPAMSVSLDDGDEEDEDEADPDLKVVTPVSRMLPDLRPFIEKAGIPFRPSAWVPDGMIIVVPKDRTFVGLVNQVTSKKIAGVVHNAARGIAIVQGGVSDELADQPLPQLDAG